MAVVRDQQTTTSTLGELVKPGGAALYAMGLNVKCNRCVHHVVVVDLSQAQWIGSTRHTNVNIAHELLDSLFGDQRTV
jgi:hypothetical protein